MENITGKESYTYWMTPESWCRRYNRIGLSLKSLGIMSLIITIILSIIYPCLYFPLILITVIVITIPCVQMMTLIYKSSGILDVDEDPERYSAVLEEIEKHVWWIQRGWVLTEKVRAKIAEKDFETAKEMLNADSLNKGMAKFYIGRKIELRGIIAILEGNKEELRNCLNELAIPVTTCCGITDITKENVLRIQRNWQYLEGKCQL